MFIRRSTKITGSGRRTYVSLAHNVRERLPTGETRPKPIIFARLGREDELDADTVKGMRDALDRYLRERFGDGAAEADVVKQAADDVRFQAPALRVLASRAYGMRVLVEHVWKDLGLGHALQRVEREHDIAFPFERIVFAMVLNRLVDPTSKRACNEWARHEAWLPELENTEVHHFYRALDLMNARTDDILAAVGRAAREACGDNPLEMLLIDTTTSYSESEYDDVERRQIFEEWEAYMEGNADKPNMPLPQVVNDPPLRMRGHSKDHRPTEPQVKLGLVSTPEGRVVDLQVCAGNVHDQRLTLDLLTAARSRMPDVALVAVMDSGMGGAPNLAAIDDLEGDLHRVSAVPLRKSKFADDELLAKAGRWRRHPYREDFQVRDILLDADASPSGRPERWVATRNGSEARRQRALLDKELERIKSALADDDRADGHGKPMCKLLSNSKRRRYIRLNTRGDRYVLDHERIRVERRRAGVHVVRSTLTTHPVELTLRAYDAQYGIEAQFRTLKSPLRLRPMYHRADRRIRGHVLMCGLALMVCRELERRSGETLDTLRRSVGRVRAVEVQQGRTVFWQCEEWSQDALAILKAVGADPGAKTWGARKVEAE